MTLGSLFDGSGTCPLAATMCGITPVWASEIEPYPIKVTKKNFPQMKHLGDVTQIKGDEIEPVDIITFGSPCQDLSVAGKRAGIHDGQRSSLFFEAIRIIKEMREETNGKYPRYAVWENVPGAFSSNRGRDFLAVLQAFGEVTRGCNVPEPAVKQGKLQWGKDGCVMGDGFSIAWRVLDAQYWGVPQRRKRIYLVADFGGERAGEILFKREGLRWDFTPCGAAWERTAADAAGSAGGSGGTRCLNPWDNQSKRVYEPDGVFPTLPAMDCSGTNNQAGLYALDSLSSNSMKSANPHSGFHAEAVAKTLQGNGIDRADTAGCNGKGWREDVSYTLNTIDRPAICFKAGQGAKARSLGESETVAPTLGSEAGGNSVPAVCFKERAGCPGGGKGILLNKDGHAFTCSTMPDQFGCYPQVARTLTAEADTSPCIDRGQNIVRYDARGNGDGAHYPTLNCNHEQPIAAYSGKPPRKYIIRRLTPLECCRLQGFPDWWEDGVQGIDTARYKMWGNGMALPCVVYVMQGLADAKEAREHETD